MNKRILLLTAPVLLSLVGVAAAGGPLGLFGGGKGHSGGLVHCDKSCDHCPCYPTIEEVAVKKKCFDVECEQICVPKVRLPWPFFGRLGCKGKGCDCLRGCSGTQCGHIKTIRVLKTDSYECTECRCNWDVNGKCGGGSKTYAPPAETPHDGGADPGNVIPPPAPVEAARAPVHTAQSDPALIHVQRVSRSQNGHIIAR